jgi:uncharacterized protein (DUF2236 family)
MESAPNALSCNLVGTEDLERELALVGMSAAGEREGIFDPDSLTWRISREAAIFLGAGRALLLQLAHPWVAAAVAEHSRTLADPLGRFHRTFEVVFKMVFGTRDQAFAAARSLHRRHVAICGRMPEDAGPFAAGSWYRANDVAALTWVHATLIDSAVIAHNLMLPALSAEERERYYAESRLFAGLFGIPRQSAPSDWQNFAAYVEAMSSSDILTVSPQARTIARQLLEGRGTWLSVPRWYQGLTAHLLPSRLRTEFGFRYEEADRRAADRTIARLRRAYRLLPDRLRYVGPYQEAQARLLGRGQPGLAVRAINLFWIGKPQL